MTDRLVPVRSEDNDEHNATRLTLAGVAHDHLGFSQRESRQLVDDVFEVLANFLVDHGRVKITSFGSFVVREKSARMGRNPKTGQAVPIASRRVVSFRPCLALRRGLKPAAGKSKSGQTKSNSE